METRLEPLLTRKQVAVHFGIALKQWRRWAKENEFPEADFESKTGTKRWSLGLITGWQRLQRPKILPVPATKSAR